MKTTKRIRTVYEPLFKAKVLDHVLDLGSVSAAAQRNGLEPGLVYSWQRAEKDIRKLAAKAAREAVKTGKPVVVEKMGDKAPVSPGLVKQPALAAPVDPSPEGPQVTVRALGPWLSGVVKEALPELVDAEVERLLAAQLAGLDERIAEIVRRELKAFVAKGVGA